MTKPNLYLFTSEFPFGKQETFLEAEIPFLISKFNLIILPRKPAGKIRDGFKYPELIDDRLGALYSKHKRFHKSSAWLNLFFFKSLYIHKAYAGNSQAIKRLLAYSAEYTQTKFFLKKYFQKQVGASVMYSYWLNGIPHALCDFFEGSPDVKIVARAHRYDVYDNLYQPSFMPFRKRLLSLIDKVYCVSADGKSFINRTYNFPDKIEISRLGTVQQDISNHFTTIEKKNKNLIKVISISNIVPVKRVHLIAKYLKEFALGNSCIIEWDHFGDGPEKNLVSIELENIPENFKVTFTDRVPNYQIHQALNSRQYNFLVNLSTSEGLPVSMMEAISYGVPVLATDTGGVKEIVTPEAGILLPVDFDFIHFDLALKKILFRFSSDNAQQMKIKHYWEQNYSAQKNYLEFATKIENLIH